MSTTIAHVAAKMTALVQVLVRDNAVACAHPALLAATRERSACLYAHPTWPLVAFVFTMVAWVAAAAHALEERQGDKARLFRAHRPSWGEKITLL